MLNGSRIGDGTNCPTVAGSVMLDSERMVSSLMPDYACIANIHISLPCETLEKIVVRRSAGPVIIVPFPCNLLYLLTSLPSKAILLCCNRYPKMLISTL